MSAKLALIIANTEYTDPGLAQLTAPGRDAEDFARVLRDKEICAFDEVNILLNQPEYIVRGTIDEFFDQKKPDDLLVLYFSGHGMRDELGSLYLAAKNTVRNRLRSTGIKSDYIREAMDQSRSKRQVLILDCCNSGAFAQGTKAELGGMMGMVSALQGRGRFILTASDATQFAWEGNKVIGETQNSLFTHFLVKGLEGEADRDGDGRITVDELYDYAHDQISRLTPKQTPTKSVSIQEGEIVLRQIMRIEDIKPVALPDDLLDEIEDVRPYVREAAVQKLEKLAKGRNIGLARSAIEALEKIVADDNTTRRVAQIATQVLNSIREAGQKPESERKSEEPDKKRAEKGQKSKEDTEQLLAQQKMEGKRVDVEPVGKTLGEFRIDHLLGEGGMGAVYQAHDLSLQRDVAIKFIHPHLARRPEFRERFMQEARIMAQLDYPGIVKVYAIRSEEDILYIVMEFIKGGNLRQLLDNLITARKWIPLSEAVLLVRQLCETVEYLHRNGVLHRDIKPSNLMFKAEPVGGLALRVILTDLGLARILEAQDLDEEGTTAGTPAYMSPEQTLGRENDVRSDVYSLGILLYELAVGRLPFPIRTITEAMRYHTQVPPPSPRSIRFDLPKSLEEVILKALEKDPSKRYPSAAELGTALARMLDTTTETAKPASNKGLDLIPQYLESVEGPGPPELGPNDQRTIVDDGSAPSEGPSVFGNQAFPPSSQTRIQVVYKGNTPQLFPLLFGTVNIGRGVRNDIALSDPKASQRHLQVTWDGMEYHVIDLNSTNGTYLGSARLLPGIYEVWPPNQNLRVGDTFLRLILPVTEQTVFDHESHVPRGDSIFDQKSVPPSSQTRIQVVYPEKTAQVFPFSSRTIKIGRDPNNDIPISDPKASNRHAQVIWDGMEYHVMDLNSTNGTYLGDTQLLPGIPEVWRPNENLRIGDAWLRLIPPAAEAQSTSRAKNKADSAYYHDRLTESVVAVWATPPHMSVKLGGSVKTTVLLLNRGPNADHFVLSLPDIPSTWIPNLPSSIALMPGAQRETAFTLYIPRNPKNHIGQYTMTLRVTSQIDPSQFVDVQLTLTISA